MAAIALLFLNEEDAFWCLVYIVEFLMPPDYFSSSLIGSQVDQVSKIQFYYCKIFFIYLEKQLLIHILRIVYCIILYYFHIPISIKSIENGRINRELISNCSLNLDDM